MSQNMRAILWVLSAFGLFTLSAVPTKILAATMPFVQILFLSTLVTAAILVPFVIKFGTRKAFFTTRWKLQILRIILNTLAHLAMLAALLHMSITEISAIKFMGPLFLTILAGLVLGERVTPKQWLAMVAGFTGVLIVLQPDGGNINIWGLMALIAALLSSSAATCMKILTRTESRLNLMIYGTLGVTILTLPPTLMQWQPVAPDQLILVVAIGVITATASLSWYSAFTKGEASLLAPFGYVAILFSTLFDYIFFHNIPPVEAYVGALIIGLSTGYVMHLKRSSAAT